MALHKLPHKVNAVISQLLLSMKMTISNRRHLYRQHMSWLTLTLWHLPYLIEHWNWSNLDRNITLSFWDQSNLHRPKLFESHIFWTKFVSDRLSNKGQSVKSEKTFFEIFWKIFMTFWLTLMLWAKLEGLYHYLSIITLIRTSPKLTA